MSFLHLIILLCCYFLGAIPFGYLLARRSTGLNILEHGSGNIGSTNVGRIAGKRVALRVQILDMFKGLLPVAILLFVSWKEIISMPDYFIFLAAFATVIGHNFSLFLSFRGGKGVNTTLGATILLAPLEVICAVLIYFLIKKRLKYVSAGSIALAITLPIAGVIFHCEKMLLAYLLLVCLLILIRHTSNIKRLFEGKEHLG
jgi:acyl phosphate:glycerol-3-phosphate acyltransferase